MANKQVTKISLKGTGGLKAAIITADKPEKIKKKEEDEAKRKRDSGGINPYPAGYSKKPRRINDGGIIRLKRR